MKVEREFDPFPKNCTSFGLQLYPELMEQDNFKK